MGESETGGGEFEIDWNVSYPTIYTDGVIASARAAGMHRIVLGEARFNPAPDAKFPCVRPAVNLVMTTERVQELIEYLSTLPGVAREE